MNWFAKYFYDIEFKSASKEDKKGLYFVAVAWYAMVVITILILPILVANTF